MNWYGTFMLQRRTVRRTALLVALAVALTLWAGARTGGAAAATFTVHYTAGWNLVAGPAGSVIAGAVGPLYTYQPGDTAYESLANGTPLSEGLGYWAYFSAPATGTLPAPTTAQTTRTLPPGQFVLIGNPGDQNAAVTGADAVYIYTGGGYQAATTLAPGQGAWAYSAAGGTVTIGASSGGTGRPAERCHTSGLAISFIGSEGAAGHIFDTLALTNTTNAPCSMFGFVGAQMLNAAGQELPTRVVRNGGFFSTQPGPTTFVLQPGAAALFQIEWSDVPTGDEMSCPSAASLEVTPPDEFDFLVLPVRGFGLAPCNAGTIDVTPVLPPGTQLP